MINSFVCACSRTKSADEEMTEIDHTSVEKLPILSFEEAKTCMQKDPSLELRPVVVEYRRMEQDSVSESDTAPVETEGMQCV